jgi:hypothetical protein
MNNFYYKKYLKYKILYLNLKKKQTGGAYDDIGWFELRKFTDLSKEEYDIMNVPTFIKTFRDEFLIKGGQSLIFNSKIDKNLLIRLIEEISNLQNELILIKAVSEFIIQDINPHFVNSPYIKENMHLMERFDGDIKEFGIDNNIHFQLLTAFISLINNGILFTDIKKENILYKKLSSPIILNYKIGDDIYKLKTDTVVAFTDYGKAYKYYEEDSIQHRFSSFFQFITLVVDKEPKTSDDFKAYLRPKECTDFLNMSQFLKLLSKEKIINCLIFKLKSIYVEPEITDDIEQTNTFDILKKL